FRRVLCRSASSCAARSPLPAAPFDAPRCTRRSSGQSSASMLTLKGTYPALVTPFRNGEIDEEALRALVEHVIEGGVDGLVPCGTTGESVTLSDAEHRRVVSIVVEQAKKRVPVIAGAGTVSTAHTIHLAEQAKDAGADALLLVCPYYNRPTQAGLE